MHVISSQWLREHVKTSLNQGKSDTAYQKANIISKYHYVQKEM